MKHPKMILLLIMILTSVELSAQAQGHLLVIGPKYNIIQYRANVRKEPNIKSDVIAILSVHDEIEILENTMIEEEIDDFTAFWYKIKYRDIVGYTFGGNIAAETIRTDIDKNGIDDYFYLRYYNYKDESYRWRRPSKYHRLISNRDIIIYINNRRIGTNKLTTVGYNRYLVDYCELRVDQYDQVRIELQVYGSDTRDISRYKIKSDGSIEEVERTLLSGSFD